MRLWHTCLAGLIRSIEEPMHHVAHDLKFTQNFLFICVSPFSIGEMIFRKILAHLHPKLKSTTAKYGEKPPSGKASLLKLQPSCSGASPLLRCGTTIEWCPLEAKRYLWYGYIGGTIHHQRCKHVVLHISTSMGFRFHRSRFFKDSKKVYPALRVKGVIVASFRWSEHWSLAKSISFW